MLFRKAFADMLRWKNSPRKRALLITGARQIGKTFLVRHFAKENYDSFIELNFALDSDAAEIFVESHNPKDILLRLSLRASKPIVPKKTLFFFDEIQEAPEVLTAIKGLVDQGTYDYILSGSMLGVELRNITSLPVGYVNTLVMHPLDFEEFCWALTGSREIFSYLHDCFEKREKIDQVVNKQLNELFKKYIIVGGMPQAVQTFTQTSDITLIREIQENIKNWYRTDISKYCPDSEKLKTREAFDLIPAELNNPNKRFVLKNLHENIRFRAFEDALLWLTHGDVANAAYNVTTPVSPLLISKSRNLFKLFHADTGILMSCYSKKVSEALLTEKSEVNFGAMFENVAAQEFVAHGFELYYFNNKKYGELDFVLEDCDGRILPIEIRSGKDYKRHRALANILDVKDYRLEEGFVFGATNLSRKGKVTYLPAYMMSLFFNE